MSDGGAGTCAATLQRATLVLTHAAPDAGVLAGLESPGEALGSDGAAVADDLRLRDLREGGPGIADGEEQLGIFIATDGLVTPVNGNSFGVRPLVGCVGEHDETTVRAQPRKACGRRANSVDPDGLMVVVYPLRGLAPGGGAPG